MVHLRSFCSPVAQRLSFRNGGCRAVMTRSHNCTAEQVPLYAALPLDRATHLRCVPPRIQTSGYARSFMQSPQPSYVEDGGLLGEQPCFRITA